MVWAKPSVFSRWLGGNALDHKNEPSSMSWEQGPVCPLALSSPAQPLALLMDSRCKMKPAVLVRFSSMRLGGKDGGCPFAAVRLICRC